MTFYGECAWSFYASMGMVHQYSDFPPSSTVCKISKLLDLSVEIYTTEPGEQFAEHYYCKSGNVLIDQCVDYEEFWWDERECPTIDDFNAGRDGRGGKAFCDLSVGDPVALPAKDRNGGKNQGRIADLMRPAEWDMQFNSLP